jgi:hypothetical protein
MPVEAFDDLLGQGSILSSIRYGYLHVRGENGNIAYKTTDGEIKVIGSYGL